MHLFSPPPASPSLALPPEGRALATASSTAIKGTVLKPQLFLDLLRSQAAEETCQEGSDQHQMHRGKKCDKVMQAVLCLQV